MDYNRINLDKEKIFYDTPSFQKNHLLNSKLFYSVERNEFAYIFPKNMMIYHIQKRLNTLNPKILIAPFGTGNDIYYVKKISDNIFGVDISETALKAYTGDYVKTFICDISNMDIFQENTFDIVYASLFFHHFRNNFDIFLNEIYRVLKPGGWIFILEPSRLYPFGWITRLLKILIGNITGQVEDEGPFLPIRMIKAMKRCGYKDIVHLGASFSHNRFPIFIQKLINKITKPFLNIPVIRSFAWMCIYSGNKDMSNLIESTSK
jgi:SAM-dependent methyltransferase